MGVNGFNGGVSGEDVFGATGGSTLGDPPTPLLHNLWRRYLDVYHTMYILQYTFYLVASLSNPLESI